MNANRRNARSNRNVLHKLTGHSARAVRRTVVTLGDLVSAAYEVGGSPNAAAKLLSPVSPLGRLLDRHIVIATH